MEVGCHVVILLLVATTGIAVEEQVLLNFYNSLGMQPLFPAKSCREIYKYNYASHDKSGEYWIKPSVNDKAIKVYCDMELSCGGRDGGWMRIANIQNGGSCPNGWKQILSPAKACRANSDAAGCYSAFFSNNKFSYQHICGKVVGYQKGTTDAFTASSYTTYPSKAIDGPYVDGVSLTYGTPRKHLFTYASGLSSDRNFNGNCPCAKYPGTNPPSFVQGDYYCESGNTESPAHDTVYHATDPLWDGKGCNAGNSCCSQAGIPWFYRDALGKINESIEARICRDQVYSDEGILIKDLELYSYTVKIKLSYLV